MSEQIFKPHSFVASNIGDGKTVKLTWAVIDISQVQFFIVEHYDRHKRTWLPYDGFHGVVQPDRYYANTRYSVDVAIDDVFGQHTFRVKSINLDDTESEWLTATVDVERTTAVPGDGLAWYVDNGLQVRRLDSKPQRVVTVDSGSAVIAGEVVNIFKQVDLQLASDNAAYAVYIDADSVISVSDYSQRPNDVMLLAKVVIDTNGAIIIYDLRFLWGPDEVTATWIQDAPTPTVTIGWQPYLAVNLASFSVYRSQSIDDLRTYLGDSRSGRFVDTSGLVMGATYYYTICARDYGGHISPDSETASVLVGGDDEKPAVPIGLTVSVSYQDGRFIARASWTPNTEDDMSHYLLHMGDADGPYHYHQRAELADYVGITLNNLPQYSAYKCAIEAVDKAGNRSGYSTPVYFNLFDNIAPAAPEWLDLAPQTWGVVGGDAYAKLRWAKVVSNADGSPCLDLHGYKLYRRFGDTWISAGTIEDNVSEEVEYTVSGLYTGNSYTYVVVAVDKFNNESAYSPELTFIAGNLQVPAAPQNLVAVSINKPVVDNECVDLSWDSVTTDTNGNPCQVTSYAVYRNRRHPDYDGSQIAIVNHDPVVTTQSWRDTDVYGGVTYHYTVTAINDAGNESAKSNVATLLVGDMIAPSAPVLTQLTTAVVGEYCNNTVHFTGGNEPDLAYYEVVYLVAGEGSVTIGRIQPDPDSTEYTFTHENVQYGTKAYYAAYAIDASGNRSSRSNKLWIIAGEDYVPPAPIVTAVPTYTPGVDGSQGEAGIDLTWNAVTEAVSYAVHRSVDGEYFAPLDNTELTSFSDTALVNGKRYWYRVYAVAACGAYSEPGVADAIAGFVEQPPTPVVTATAVLGGSRNGAHAIDLSWPAVSHSVPIYRYVVSKLIVGDTYAQIAEVDGLSYRDTGLQYGSLYSYRVYAVDIEGNMSESGQASCTIKDSTIPPSVAAPQATIDMLNGQPRITLQWSYGALNDFDRFEIWGGIKGAPTLIASIANQDTKSYSIFGVEIGKTYSFAVKVYDVYGNASQTLNYTPDIVPGDNTIPGDISYVNAAPGLNCIFVTCSVVTQNTDGSNILDLEGYELRGSTIQGFMPDSATVRLFSTSNSFVHAVNGDDTPYYYAVRAVDMYGNTSGWAFTTEPVTAEITDTQPPTPPTLVSAIGGIEELAGGQRNFYLECSWSHDTSPDDMKHYNVHVRRASDPASRTIIVANVSDTSHRINNLLPGIAYAVGISTSDYANNQSEIAWYQPDPVTAIDEAAPDTPANAKLVRGVGLFALSWSSATESDFDHYEVQYAVSGQQSVVHTEADWNTVFIGSNNYFMHGGSDSRLDYNLFYQYRVRTVDTSGNASSWVRVANDDIDPAEADQADIAANAIFGKHIYAGSVTSDKIKAGAVTADKLAAKAVTADKIAAGAIDASHLNVSVGAANAIHNSAFGMVDAAGTVTDWAFTGDTQVVEALDSPISADSALALSMVDGGTQPAATQSLVDIFALCNTPCVLSAYIKHNVATTGPATVKVVADSAVVAEISANPHDAWARHVSTQFEIPTGTGSLAIEVSYSGIGTAYVTGIKLEQGTIATAWSPAPGEAYGAGGSVQINSSGIVVNNGKLHVSTDNNKVTIDSSGIWARASDSAYARLNGSGLTIANGAFNIQTGADASTGLVIDSGGLRAYRKGSVSVQIGIDGNMLIDDGTLTFGSTNKLKLNSTGISAYRGITEVLRFNTDDGSLAITGGQFEINTGVGQSQQNCIQLAGNSLKMYGSTYGETILAIDASTGKVDMCGNTISLRTASSGPRAVFDVDGLTGYTGYVGPDGTNEIAWRLSSSGNAEFYGGHFKVASGDNAVGIDMTSSNPGMYGPGWSLTQNGATLNSATIQNGAVRLDANGMTVQGNQGVTIKDAYGNTKVTMTQAGIKLLAAGAINVSSGGTITVGNSGQVAISATGINANAIKTGSLVVGGATPGQSAIGSIYVRDSADTDCVVINNNGIEIHDGRLTLHDIDGNVSISNGKIVATSLDIGTGSSNLVMNGRGDFDIDNWAFADSASGTISVASTMPEFNNAPAGVSGQHAFRVSSRTTSNPCQQTVTGFVPGEKYTLSAYVVPVAGSVTVSLCDGSGSASAVGTRALIKFTFTPTTTSHVLKVTCSAINGAAYITDICVVEGFIHNGYAPHYTEFTTGNGHVAINKNGITIDGSRGSLAIRSAGGALTLDSAGLSLDVPGKTQFHLSETGLGMNFGGETNVTIDESGITSSDLTPDSASSVTIRGGKLSITGSGGLNIVDEIGSTKLSITGGYVKSEAGESFVKLGYDDGQGSSGSPFCGLMAVGSNVLSIRSGPISSLEPRMVIEPSSIRLYNAGQAEDSLPAINIGLNAIPEDQYNEEGDLTGTVWHPGINIAAGKFNLGGDTNAVRIDHDKITVRHTDWDAPGSTAELPKVYSSVLDASGLWLYEDGMPITNLVGYTAVYAGMQSEQPIDLGQNGKKVRSGSTSIVVVPHRFSSYDPNYSSARQYVVVGYDVELDASEQWISSITPYVRQMASCDMTTGYSARYSGSAYTIGQKLRHKSPMTITSTESQATSASMKIQWHADCGHFGDVRDYVSIKVEHYVNGAWRVIYNKRHEGSIAAYGIPNTGSEVLSVGQEPNHVKLRVTADINNGYEIDENWVKVVPLSDGVPIAIYRDGVLSDRDGIPTVDVIVMERAGTHA